MRITPHSYQVTPSVSVNISIAVIKICSRFSRISMELRLFGFPVQSPHAIPGPDDFCITKMMLLGLMELSVSGGISLHSPRLVDLKIRLCPLTQSAARLLTQQSKQAGRKRAVQQRTFEKVYKDKKNMTA
ncbi:hypothetical protein AMECASPLE_007289 [Ameca splendens]|uniref:Uncharacterized protein n=1 Tax=Ameca splendens TaxID=208324 RepID=A0ABV0Z8E8_9TELE